MIAATISTEDASFYDNPGFDIRGVVRAGLAAWLELPDHAIFRLAQRYCGVTIVDWVEGTPIVEVMNRALR